ncbi:hypothetical protein HNP71_002258 [Acidocella aromatica]|uniref:YspA cpYpsA-related SLOG domain-containing protein n=2 Tax=Acidocella aromatica TaxID=1303579 RepID=A0A840VQW9_9PROT|nr:hypothetical protein [Acidocella aromatica]
MPARMRSAFGEDRASAFERAIGRQPGRIGNGCGRRFSGASLRAAFHRETKSPAFAILRCASALSLRSGCRSVPPDGFVAMKAATVAVQPTEHPMSGHDDYEPEHSASPTDHIVQELQLYGYRPSEGEADPRPVPEDRIIEGAVADIFDALIATVADTSLDPDLDDLLWSTVNMFHRAVERADRKLDDNEQEQKRLQREQDGSEVKSVQLERLIDLGQSLIERRDSLEVFRDSAADHYLRTTGSPWSQRTGSRVNHRHLTAAMIDSRDFIAAKRRSETEVLVPPGPKIAFSGGDTADHKLIWAKLDQVHAKHPDMVLMHGGSPKGAEKIAARWAETRKVPQIAFKPDWTKHAKAAPFKRNDAMLAIMPIGVFIFPGTGIQDNLADKARKLGIPVYRFGSGGA